MLIEPELDELLELTETDEPDVTVGDPDDCPVDSLTEEELDWLELPDELDAPEEELEGIEDEDETDDPADSLALDD